MPKHAQDRSLRFRPISIGCLFVFLQIAIGGQPANGADPTAPEPAIQGDRERQLSFDPLTCTHLDLIRAQLPISAEQLALFRRQGFVVLNQAPTSNFGDAYYRIYGKDLPVLITTDSLLHVMHRSFDNTVMEVEQRMLSPTLREILAACHNELGRRVQHGTADADNYRDVDLYLTVACNLLTEWDWSLDNANLKIPLKMDQDEPAHTILAQIAAGQLQDPKDGGGTALYGGRRPIDYSQFKPRGHYTKTAALQHYFCAMMWLGRADCGWFPLGVRPGSGLTAQPGRDLRDAVLLTELVVAAGQMKALTPLTRPSSATGRVR